MGFDLLARYSLEKDVMKGHYEQVMGNESTVDMKDCVGKS